jgi:integrase
MSTDSSIDLGDHARERLLAAAAVLPAGERLLVELVVGRGVALAEALRLRGRDVRPAGLVETVSVTTRRGRRRRLLLGPLAASLGRELASAGDGRPLLRTRYGRPLSADAARRVLQALGEQAGLGRRSVHALRRGV